VRSDDLRGQQFSTHRPGYDKTEVEAFLNAAGLRLAALESTDIPAGPLVSGPLLVAWAEWADSTTFSTTRLREAYDTAEVGAFREAIRDTFMGIGESPVRADGVRGKKFSSTDWSEQTEHAGYDKKQVAAFLDAAGLRLAAMESTDRPQGPLVSGAILAGWAEWADSTRFSTAGASRDGYVTAEVDAFQEGLRDTLLGVRQPLLTSDEARDKQFTTDWAGYDSRQVDAFLLAAAWRLAVMESPDRPEGRTRLRFWREDGTP